MSLRSSPLHHCFLVIGNGIFQRGAMPANTLTDKLAHNLIKLYRVLQEHEVAIGLVEYLDPRLRDMRANPFLRLDVPKAADNQGGNVDHQNYISPVLCEVINQQAGRILARKLKVFL